MSKEIRALTGIRGLAASYVVIYHIHIFHDAVSSDAHGLWRTFLSNGYLAVDLFFVLSGFVMALSYERFVQEGWTKTNYRSFLIRRLARIYPLYIFMLILITLPVALGLSKAFSWNAVEFLENLFLIQAWGLSDSINSSSWSISTEFAAYLLFPILTALTLKGQGAKAKMMSLTAVIIICLLPFVPTPDNVTERDGQLDLFWMPSLGPLLRCISEFTLGLVIYRLSKNAAVAQWMRKPIMAYILTLSVLGLLFLPRADVITVLLLPSLVLVLALGDNIVVRVIGSGVIFFLGEISYSLYMVHGQFLRIRRLGNAKLSKYFGDNLADLMSLALEYGAIVFFSWLSYRYLEKPCRRWIRKWEVKSPATTTLSARGMPKTSLKANILPEDW